MTTPPNTPVDGPFRITVEPIPAGVTLDVEAFVAHVVSGVVETLLTDRYADRLDALHEQRPRDPHLIERSSDLPFESLVADLVAEVSTRMPVYGMQALRLAARIEQLAAPAVAGLRAAEGGAAA
ncbi:hypothetical protein ACF1BE_19640 [Streptomyces sp. NPDC014991]|uniref:hypothetical protein n=1 Tax=Streptomyces sp. NPDC014991 TaxID=3364935 RepID=UPI0036F699AB